VTNPTDLTDREGSVAKDVGGTRSLLAVAGLFAVNGLLIGGIGGTLPAMRQRLGVDAGGLLASPEPAGERAGTAVTTVVAP